jgi:hypothetical protein
MCFKDYHLRNQDYDDAYSTTFIWVIFGFTVETGSLGF